MAGNDGSEGRYASPPCMGGEIAPDYFDPLGVDPEQARDVARWRRAERLRLRAERQALSVDARVAVGAALSGHLRDLLADRFGDMRDRVFSAYWPIKGEPDLRPLMADLHGTGVQVALPLVEVKQAPLVFRRYAPGDKLTPNGFGTSAPAPDAEAVLPDIVVAPLLGFTRAGGRLGYGGGFYDRTLEALRKEKQILAVGFAYGAQEVDALPLSPLDQPLDYVVTEREAIRVRSR